MAFVCPPRLELLKKRRILTGIRSVLQEIEQDMAAKIQYQCCNPQCYPPNLPNSQCCLQKAQCSPQKAQFDSQNAQCSAQKARCSPQNAQCGSGEAQNADRCLKPESPKKEACSDCSFKEKEEPKPETKPEPPDVMVNNSIYLKKQ